MAESEDKCTRNSPLILAIVTPLRACEHCHDMNSFLNCMIQQLYRLISYKNDGHGGKNGVTTHICSHKDTVVKSFLHVTRNYLKKHQNH